MVKNRNERPTVLIVEDQQEIRSMMTNMLEQRGYRVIASLDYDEAVILADCEHPDLVLVDLELPTLEHLLKSESFGGMPIVTVDPCYLDKPHDERLTILKDFDELENLL